MSPPNSTELATEGLLAPDIVLNSFDSFTVVLYFFAIFGISWWVSRPAANKTGQGAGNANGISTNTSKPEFSASSYFSADNNVNWLGIALSLFASNIGSEHFVGLAGTAAYSGFAIGWFELGAIPLLALLGLVFLPVYLQSKAATVPSYIEMRYGVRARIVVVSITLLIYVLTKISASLLACTILIIELFPESANPYFITALHIAASGTYTMIGGLQAVIYTESIQTCVLLLGGFIVLASCLSTIGGFPGMITATEAALSNQTVFDLALFRPASDETMPWPAVVTGYYAFSLWYWTIDQNIVQRALASRDINHGAVGCLVAAVLKFLPFFLMVLPGVCGRLILENALVPATTPAEKKDMQGVLQDTDRIYAYLLKTIIPLGARGIVLAGLLSALMSSLASVFNSSSTLFALNVWKAFRPNSTERQLVLVGKLVVVVMAIISLLWLPVMMMLSSHLFLIIQAPPAFLAPPITCVVIFGMFSSIPNRYGADATLGVGIFLGLMRLILENVEVIGGHAKGSLFGPFTGMHFMYFAVVQFAVSSFLLFLVSLITKRILNPILVVSPASTQRDHPLSDLMWHRHLRAKLIDEIGKPSVIPPPVTNATVPIDNHIKSATVIDPKSAEVLPTSSEQQQDLDRESLDDDISTGPPSMPIADPIHPAVIAPAPDRMVKEAEMVVSDNPDNCLIFTSGCPGLSIKKRTAEWIIRSLCIAIFAFWLVAIICLQEFGTSVEYTS